MIDITEDIEEVLKNSDLSSGTCTIFVSGSTGSIITIEYEEGLLKDFPSAMERMAPTDAVYEHHLRWRDGNGHSHVRASIVGPSLTVPFIDSNLTLGTWQQITLVDFDNKARRRNVEVMIVGE